MQRINFVLLCYIPTIAEVYGGYDLYTLKPVEKPPWMTWIEQMGNSHLAALTAEIVRDSIGRMRTINQQGKRFEKNVMYKIGAVASSINNLFDKMVKIYKDVSNITSLKRLDWYYISAVNRTIGAISMTQSLLHRIRLEKRLFMEIVRQDLDEKMAEHDSMVAKFGHPPSSGGKKDMPLPGKMKGGMFVPRRSNDWYEEDFESKFDFDSILTRRMLKDPIQDDKITQKEPQTTKTPVNLAPKPGEGFEAMKADKLPNNPYSDLSRLLASSGARRSKVNLLKLIPSEVQPNVKETPRRRVVKERQRDKTVPRARTASNNKATAKQDFNSRRSLDDHNNGRSISKTPLWQPASELQRSHLLNDQAKSERSSNNLHSVDNKRETTELKPSSNQDGAVSSRGPIRDKLVENKANIETSQQKPQKDDKAMKEMDSNRQISQVDERAIVKRPLWKPGQNIQLSYGNNYDTMTKRLTDKNNVEINSTSVANRRHLQNGAMQPIRQPMVNLRPNDNDNGKVRRRLRDSHAIVNVKNDQSQPQWPNKRLRQSSSRKPIWKPKIN